MSTHTWNWNGVPGTSTFPMRTIAMAARRVRCWLSFSGWRCSASLLDRQLQIAAEEGG